MNTYIKNFLDSNDEQFNYKPVQIAGEDLLLITPKGMGTSWNEYNKNFRSIIVDPITYKIVSMGFSKFTNYGERPEFEPWDDSWEFEARHKLDGSLLIVSKFKGELVVRTRGTVDARNLQNGHEIDFLIKKYPHAFDNLYLRNEHTTFLFEWTTPTNIIVLREHDEPTLTLLGIVQYDCQIAEKLGRNGIYYWSETDCDIFANLYELPRPKVYHYNSLAECLADVVAWEGKEGVVMRKGQIRRKVKSDLYNEAHKLATGLTTLNHVLGLFLVSPRFTKYSEFYNYVENIVSYEVAEKLKDKILVICVAYSKVVDKWEKVKQVVENVRHGFARKEQALEFQQHYDDWRLPLAFALLDNRPVPDKITEIAILTEINK